MDERDRLCLERMVEHANKAIDYRRDGGRSWWKDERTYDAVLTRITQVAEAAVKVSAETAKSIQLPWAQIRGARNRIVHNYAETQVDVVRDIVKTDLPAVARVVSEYLRREARPTHRPARGAPRPPR